ncbi:MAG: putative deacylase [Nonlabens sp.]|jgi:predicted deacylase
MIRDGLTGVHNVLSFLGMTNDEMEEIDENTVLCKRSYWIFSDTGGIMTTYPKVTDLVKKGDVIATMRDIFGGKVKDYLAPEDGIVIGKSVNPVNQTGGRILHLGIVK